MIPTLATKITSTQEPTSTTSAGDFKTSSRGVRQSFVNHFDSDLFQQFLTVTYPELRSWAQNLSGVSVSAVSLSFVRPSSTEGQVTMSFPSDTTIHESGECKKNEGPKPETYTSGQTDSFVKSLPTFPDMSWWEKDHACLNAQLLSCWETIFLKFCLCISSPGPSTVVLHNMTQMTPFWNCRWWFNNSRRPDRKSKWWHHKHAPHCTSSYHSSSRDAAGWIWPRWICEFARTMPLEWQWTFCNEIPLIHLEQFASHLLCHLCSCHSSWVVSINFPFLCVQGTT